MLAHARPSAPFGPPPIAHRGAADARCHLQQPSLARLHWASKPANHRPQAVSVLALGLFGGGGGDSNGGNVDAGGGAAEALTDRLPADVAVAALPDAEAAALRADVNALKDRMDEIAAQLEQLNDRARDRAVSLAEAVRAAGSGDAVPMEQLQHQQDEQLAHDEASWETMMDSFTQLMSKGYISSVSKIRDRLLLEEWELARKALAQRRGVSHFEQHCAEHRVDLPYDLLTRLYEDPGDLEIIEDPHVRMAARATINAAVDEEYGKCWSHCTAEAGKLASQFSNTEFLSKLLPESGILDALKKVVPMAIKAIV